MTSDTEGVTVDQELFDEGKKAYAERDFRAAARSFLAAAGDDAQGSGQALHNAGNALMRLNRYEDAATAYEHALEDSEYESGATVASNLGAALRAAGDYDRAVEAYDIALHTPGFAKPWKAYLGKAGALYEMGRLDEAAAAYRSAALESENPDAGKALNNLGLCYMALGRPDDAVEAYSTALTLKEYDGAGRACANLGLALSAQGMHPDAVQAFRRATDEYDFELSGGLEEAYRVSTDAVASAVALPLEGEGESGAEGEDPFEHIQEPDTEFFTRTEDEMREIDKKARKDERRASRTSGGRIMRIALIVVLVAVVVGAAAWAWMSGLGYPSHTSTVEGLLETYSEGATPAEYSEYWIAVPENDIEQEMGKLPPNYTQYAAGSVDADATTAQVTVSVELEGGAPLQFEFSLAREGVGWRVTGIENDWRSTGGGS